MSSTTIGAAGAGVGEASAASRVRWFAVAPTLLVVWIVGMLDKSNISIVIADPGFLTEMGLQGKQALLGWLTTGLIISYGVAAPAWGLVVTAIGARRAMMASLILWAVVCVVAGLSASFGALLAARIVLGIAEAALYPITVSMVAHWFPMRERGRATASWWIGTMIGPMVTGALVTWLIVNFGWRAQFHVLAALAVFLPLPMVYFLLRDTPRAHPGVNDAEASLIEAGSIEHDQSAPGRILRARSKGWLSNHRYWLIIVSTIFNSIFFWGWSSWMPTYLKTARHFSFSKAGYLTFVMYGCATLTILLFGRFSDRIYRRAPIAGAGWLLAGVFLLSATLVSDASTAVVLMTASLCAQQAGVSSAHMLFHSVVGAKDIAKSQGYATALQQILGSFSPVLIGYLLEGSGGDFTLGFVILAGAAVVAASCMAALAKEGL